MATLKEFIEKLRTTVDEAVGDWTDGVAFMSEFDRAIAKTALELMDGTSSTPKKRTYTRKPKPAPVEE